jgi:hypothetical protein
MNQSVINICIVVIAVVVLFLVLRFLNNQNISFIPKVPLNENFEQNNSGPQPSVDVNDDLDNNNIAPYQGSVTQQGTGSNKQTLTARELLPQDTASNQWAQANPTGSGSLQDVNLLQAGHHIGINTVGQTLRNANLQLRSDPPNPQVKVSPWLQSTINPDTNRQPLEIGCGAL